MLRQKSFLSFLFMTMVLLSSTSYAQENTNTNKFKQLGHELPSPNVYRSASGVPGPQYWQQKADYDIKLELDDATQKIHGQETITYTNKSPDALNYLWLQLDQNVRAQDSDSKKIMTGSIDESRVNMRNIKRLMSDFDGGFKLEEVKDKSGKDLHYVVNNTMMRVDLPTPLKSGASYSFQIKWWYNINNRMEIGGRSGYEHFAENDNYLYTIAQFYPRMCVYDEVNGWQNKQFLGRGEFALSFGDYKVSITVPSDHVVASTGELQNASSVLTSEQRKRLEQAKNSDKPVIIITEDEARVTEKTKATDKKTWTFHAKNVRDFGFASSRKFVWDAQGVKFGNRTVMAMSYYPKEGNPLWERYSTKAVVHTLDVYSKHTFDYPYPVAISVHAASIGMEYPMICFNFGRPEKDGTYSARTKYGMIGVIIHEVGHNYFPMIVNSDERQWTWMDEGLNSFLQYLTEQEWERDYPSRRGPPKNIINYMKGDKSNISPIMSNSEVIHQFGNNAYGKPATALSILRETVMGRELFDFAFKQYSRQWMFKHPEPADFFRSMEDASAVDLDWFWRGWFYTTDHVDISIDNVRWFKLENQDPAYTKPLAKKEFDATPKSMYQIRNRTDIKETFAERDDALNDFYNKYDRYEVNALDKIEYEKFMGRLGDKDKALIEKGYNFYEVKFSNIGGLVMPLVLEFKYADGTKELQRIPAEVWQKYNDKITKIFVKEKEVVSITLDPYLELADTDTSNNYWPDQPQPTRFQLFKEKKLNENTMQRDRRAKEAAKGE